MTADLFLHGNPDGHNVYTISLKRFVKAQESNYENVHSRIIEERKRSLWTWYIFLQFKEFVHSYITEYYRIEDKSETEAYLQLSILGYRIKETSKALLCHKDKNIKEIFSELDTGKVRSCLISCPLMM